MAKKKVQVSALADFRFAPTSGSNPEEYHASVSLLSSDEG